jgi:hypothetical protein
VRLESSKVLFSFFKLNKVQVIFLCFTLIELPFISFRFQSKANVLDLFKTQNMLKKTLIQMFTWFTASFVYFGLSINSDTLIPGIR